MGEHNRPSVNLSALRSDAEAARRGGYELVLDADTVLEALDEIERLREALDGLLSSDPRSDERNRAIARAECVLRGSDG